LGCHPSPVISLLSHWLAAVQVDSVVGTVRGAGQLPSQHRLAAGVSTDGQHTQVCAGDREGRLLQMRHIRREWHRRASSGHWRFCWHAQGACGETIQDEQVSVCPQWRLTGLEGAFLNVQVWDLENTRAPLMEIQAHAGIVNAIDGCGGQAKGYAPPPTPPARGFGLAGAAERGHPIGRERLGSPPCSFSLSLSLSPQRGRRAWQVRGTGGGDGRAGRACGAMGHTPAGCTRGGV
jgi:hypothetical protein